MTLEVVFVARSGATAGGKDWDTFMTAQSNVLAERGGDGWDLVTAVDVIAPSAMTEASRTAGVLLYFRHP